MNVQTMKSGTCPRCGSEEVHSGANVFSKTGTMGSNTIPIGGLYFGSVALDNYVCVACGYVESYVGGQKARHRIAKRWPRVSSKTRAWS